jgi:DnaJ-class molecular chaperone
MTDDPEVRCQNCQGRGMYYSIEDEYFRHCKECKGTGEEENKK